MSDVTFILAIASFFGVSTDELFDFNLYEKEKDEVIELSKALISARCFFINR